MARRGAGAAKKHPMEEARKPLRGTSMGDYGDTRSSRMLMSIRRSMDLVGTVMRKRRRNEEVLSLAYTDGSMIGGGDEIENLRTNAKNLPWRQARWFEAQTTGKKLVVKVNRDAGAGQRPGGPADDVTGMWLGIGLQRIAYEAGFQREMRALINEVIPRGVSVMAIGYHEEVVSLTTASEVGKDTQTVAVEVLQTGDTAAKPGQADSDLSRGLANVADDPLVQMQVGPDGVGALLERKAAHDAADLKAEKDETPRESTRLIRHKIWMQKKRFGEDVGPDPSVYDTLDAKWWWDRHVWTVAEVKASDLFTPKFKKEVRGMDSRQDSAVARGGKTTEGERMSGDARAAGGEDVLSDDERFVEWFAVYIRRPEMKAGGIRKIVSAEFPDEFVEADDSYPFVDDRGFCLIPGFYPFYDFAPHLSSLPVPERTTGIPPVAVGMTQFEQLCEYNRLRHESALRHSLRFYEIHPGVKDKKRILRALKEGEDGFAYVADQSQVTIDGKFVEGVRPVQFTGNTQEIDRQAGRTEKDWTDVTGMPPAILQGMGTADTLGQDKIGVAAGQAEQEAELAYYEQRLSDVFAGLRGLARGNYDDEDWVRIVGEEGKNTLKAWQTGTEDDGDEIEVAFGMRAARQEAVERKQLMEAIAAEQTQVDPLTGQPKYDVTALFEELHRRLGVGAPKLSAANADAKDKMLMQFAAIIQQLTGVNPLQPGGAGGAPGGAQPSPQGGDARERGGPAPSEGDGPMDGPMEAGARRGTGGTGRGRPGTLQTQGAGV